MAGVVYRVANTKENRGPLNRDNDNNRNEMNQSKDPYIIYGTIDGILQLKM